MVIVIDVEFVMQDLIVPTKYVHAILFAVVTDRKEKNWLRVVYGAM